MRHRSIAVVLFAAVLFLGTMRQVDAQVYIQTGYGTPVTYTTYYPTYSYVTSYPVYSYPSSSYSTPWNWTWNGWDTYRPANYYWNGSYNYGYTYTYPSWNGNGGRGRGWRR